MLYTWCKRLLLFLALSSACAAQITNPSGRPFASVTGCSTDAAGTITCAKFNATTGFQYNGAAPSGDVLMGNGTNYVDAVPGIATSRTDATASVTLNCSTANDRNKVVVLTNAGAIALTGFTPGAGCPDGANIFVDVRGAAAVATLTPAAGNCNGAATCTMAQGFWRVRSDGSQTFANIEPRSASSNSGTLTNVAASLPLNQLVQGNTYPDTLTTTINTDSTGAKLGVATAGAANVDAGYKYGASAVSGFVGIGLTSAGFASGHAVNDTNFPSKRYPFAYIDGNTYSVTNGGANNAITGSFFSAPTVQGAGITKHEAFNDQGQVSGSSTISVWYGFSSAPTVNTGSTISTRIGFIADGFIGSGTVSNQKGFYCGAGLTNTGNWYCLAEDGAAPNYLTGKLAVGETAAPSEVLQIGGATGNLYFHGGKGQHIKTQAAASDISGTCTAASGTTCAITFTTNYTATPSCVVTPTANVGAFYLSAQANSGFTITYATSGAATFNYICIGNPN